MRVFKAWSFRSCNQVNHLWLTLKLIFIIYLHRFTLFYYILFAFLNFLICRIFCWISRMDLLTSFSSNVYIPPKFTEKNKTPFSIKKKRTKTKRILLQIKPHYRSERPRQGSCGVFGGCFILSRLLLWSI